MNVIFCTKSVAYEYQAGRIFSMPEADLDLSHVCLNIFETIDQFLIKFSSDSGDIEYNIDELIPSLGAVQ